MQPHARAIAIVLLVAMALAVPWPFYLVAVLAVEPVWVTLLAFIAPMVASFFQLGVVAGLLAAVFGIGFSIVVALQAALALWLFHLIARRAARSIAASPAPIPLTLAALGAISALTFLPIYGGGENIAGGGARMHDLYAELRSMYPSLGARAQREPPRAAQPATLEGMGAPQVRIEPSAPVPIEITPQQIECAKSGKTRSECAVEARRALPAR